MESKQSQHRTHLPQPSPDEAKSAREWEAEAPEAPVALEYELEELPETDEETKVVLLPVNPYLVHVYWGIAANDWEELGRVFPRLGGRAQAVLRFHDVTHVDSGGTSTPGWFEIEIDLQAKNWYVHLQSPAKSYYIDLGLRTEGSGFLRLARSNVAETPPGWPSDKVEESYLIVERDCRRVAVFVSPVKPSGVVGTLSEPSSREMQHHGEKGPECKEQRFFRTVAPEKIERIVAEVYGRRRREWSGLAPEAGKTGNPQPSGKEHVDLTELSEKSFRTGLSLGRKSS